MKYMGKKSRERMTGRTEEQRVKKPNNFKHDDSAKKELKLKNKEVYLFKYFNRMIKEGKILRKPEKNIMATVVE